MISGKTMLITGGAGTIGSVLVRQLSPYNTVIVLDNLASGHEENITDLTSVKLFKASVLSDEILRELFSTYNFDYVFHLAAHFANQNSVQYPEWDLEVNGMGTLKLLRYCKDYKAGCFIYASSSCVYGNKSFYANESNCSFEVDTPYAITKLLGERYTTFYNRHHGLNTVIVRIFNSYGPGEYPGEFRNVIINFFRSCLAGVPLVITGTGEETRDFTYNADTAYGLILAAENQDAYGQVYNIGSGQATSIVDIARKITDLTDSKSNLIFSDRRSWDTVLERKANIEKARQELGYSPRFTLAEGLERTWEWIQEVKDTPLWPKNLV